jgi:carboxymethylenebutenolidase
MVSTQMVEFKANGGSTPGYLARPESDSPSLGVVVIQEWWGLNNHIKSIAERFAGEGFVALAPDLYHGQVAAEPDAARKLAMELEYPQAIKDIQGAVNYLRDQPFVQPKQVGVIGFCMGGRLTGLMALHGQHVGAAVPFYGIRDPFTDEDVQKISVPLLCIYGEEDASIPLDVARANDAKLREAGKTIETIIYPGAPHAFFNDERPTNYRHDAAEDAWGKALGWLRKYLVGA